MPETARLSAPSNTLRIEYSKTEIERIRQKACEGLLALPRVGIGVGGLLFGEIVFTEGKAGEEHCLSVRVLGSTDIPCSHAAGPAFRLTAAEIERGRELIALSPGRVIGWYFSETRGAATLGDAELELHRDLFPGAGRIALMVRPSTVEPTHAIFFYTDQNGKVVKGIESDLDEWVAEKHAPEERASKYAPPLIKPEFQPAPPPGEVKPTPPPTSDVRPRAPGVSGTKPVSAPPLGYSTTPPAQRRRFRLIAVLALLVAGVLAFLTQNFWLPRPPLKLAVSEAGGVLMIRWNPPAVRGMNSASLFVNDGGKLRTLPLDRFVLKRGFLAYEPISERVTATLSDRNSKAMISWFAPTPKAAPDSTPPLQFAPRIPAPAAPAPGAQIDRPGR